MASVLASAHTKKVLASGRGASRRALGWAGEKDARRREVGDRAMQKAKFRRQHFAFNIFIFALPPRGQRGFTLIEMIVTMALLGLVLAVVMPKVGVAGTLSSSSRQLVGTIESLFTAAVVSKKMYRLYFDLDAQAYWAMLLTTDGDRVPTDPSLAGRRALPSGIRFQDITTSQHGKVAAGRVFVQFFPGGRMEQAVIHLLNQAHESMTLMANPLTGGVKVADHYTEPRAQPIPQDYYVFFHPLPPAPTMPFAGAFK
jgi:prepilin-type N-terminal cleavage/methylation domain-containing protein